ncbi:hypothetical protein GIB67_010765 [Kingdonia uniflora]|uniref:CUE domain-containing protein n=1 Tax=Kingdonia uniflora TaxID=39325 RepID=A0A7J7L8Z0_9MAGN|nr:hypothetical protein GIB67_010765 [Kingdonia uniflora]
MSSRSTNNNNRKKFNNNNQTQQSQKRYIPKTHNSSPTPNLTTSLRDSSSSSIRVSPTTEKPHGKFVNYLPQDEAVATGFGVENGALDPIESQRVVDLLNLELLKLLKLKPKDFWREVAGDTSLHAFLNSFLQFRRRWYDFPHHGSHGTVAGVIVGDLELNRRILLMIYRISSNRDPGARANESLSAKDHGDNCPYFSNSFLLVIALLKETKLLDLPKLLDICAIYGHKNEELTRLLVINAIKVQPAIHENLSAVVSHFLNIVYTMDQRCNSSIETLFSSEDSQNGGNRALHVLDFLNDAIASLDAFVNAYKPAAVYFSCPVQVSYGNGELLGTLAKVHDLLLPSLQQGLAHILTTQLDEVQKSYGGTLPDIAISFKILSMRIVNFCWKLLDLCYLGSEVFEEGSPPLLMASKMFPANVEDPVVRGDILVQTFRGVNEETSRQGKEKYSSGTFLQSLEKNLNVSSRLHELRGWIAMDDEQFSYLSMLMLPHKPMHKNANVSSSMVQNKVQVDESAAIAESKISQIKDIFPDYGEEFLAACLEVYNQNPEEVIQRILEGTLQDDLQSTDIVHDPRSKPGATLNRNDKGKGVLVEHIAASPFSPAVVSGTVERKVVSSSTSSSSSLFGRYTRKSKADLPDQKTLNSRGYGDSAKTVILASQYEYEDEYDDSFDDLGLSVAESGSEEPESLGKSWGAQTEGPAASSKWGSRNKPQFYVKDGKNYSYKVSGSVGVANSREASLLNQSQKEMFHGLGRGGNIPQGVVKALAELKKPQEDQDESDAPSEIGGRGSPMNPRGGRRGGRGNTYRKDRAMKKHFAGLGGF